MKQAPNGLVVLTMIAAFMVLDASGVHAQTTAGDMLEAARTRSRDIEQLKAVLNGPDQNMRLATFDVMVNSEDEVMRGIAIDVGLASTDPLLRGFALKETLLALNQIVFHLEVDASQPAPIQEHAKSILDERGSIYRLPIRNVDQETGTFRTSHDSEIGQVSGTKLVFVNNGEDRGDFDLEDERTLKGTIMIRGRKGFGGFMVTAKIR